MIKCMCDTAAHSVFGQAVAGRGCILPVLLIILSSLLLHRRIRLAQHVQPCTIGHLNCEVDGLQGCCWGLP